MLARLEASHLVTWLGVFERQWRLRRALGSRLQRPIPGGGVMVSGVDHVVGWRHPTPPLLLKLIELPCRHIFGIAVPTDAYPYR